MQQPEFEERELNYVGHIKEVVEEYIFHNARHLKHINCKIDTQEDRQNSHDRNQSLLNKVEQPCCGEELATLHQSYYRSLVVCIISRYQFQFTDKDSLLIHIQQVVAACYGLDESQLECPPYHDLYRKHGEAEPRHHTSYHHRQQRNGRVDIVAQRQFVAMLALR